MKNKKKLSYYSTNPDFKPEEITDFDDFKIEPKNQNLEVWIDKHRAGKTAVIIKGFIGNNDDLKSLSKIDKGKSSLALFILFLDLSTIYLILNFGEL